MQIKNKIYLCDFCGKPTSNFQYGFYKGSAYATRICCKCKDIVSTEEIVKIWKEKLINS